jgi:endonuclease/exonuclease/phosphatase family metal-dependent hydrolase
VAALTLMTYNILDGPADRLDALAAVIGEVGPDVLACQEVTDLPGILTLAARLGLWPVLAPANGPEVPDADRDRVARDTVVPEQTVLLSRYPVVGFTAHRGDARVAFRSVLEAAGTCPDSAS